MNHYDVVIERLDAVALINLRCEESTATAIGDTIGLVFPIALFQIVETDAVQVVRLSPDQWWIRTRFTEEGALLDQLTVASRDHFAAVTVISDHFQGFSLSGADVNAVLNQALSVNLADLPAGSVIRARFARTGATVFMREPEIRSEVFVESSYGDYAEQWLQTAAGMIHEESAPSTARL